MAIDQSSKPVLCACGCGQPAPIHSRTGKQCLYAQSHNARINRRSYVRVRRDGESAQVHVLVAELALGKPLPPRTPVHHVDGNRRNNANRNLVICQDHAYHMLLHHRARVIRAGGDPNTHSICCDCDAVQPLAAFNLFKGNTSTGRRSDCRECQAIRFKKWYAKREKRGKAA